MINVRVKNAFQIVSFNTTVIAVYVMRIALHWLRDAALYF